MKRARRGINMQDDFAEAVSEIVIGNLVGANFQLVRTGVVNVVVVVIVSGAVGPGWAGQFQPAYTPTPNAALPCQATQGQFVMAQVAAAGTVEAAIEVTPGVAGGGSVAGTSGPSVHSVVL